MVSLTININKGIDFWNEVSMLEPECKGCKTKIDYGVTTVFDEKKDALVCKNCGTKVD